MRRRTVDWRNLMASVLRGVLVLMVARLLVVVSLAVIYSFVPQLLLSGESARFPELHEIYYLLFHPWILTAYALWGGIAGGVVWTYRNGDRPRRLTWILRWCVLGLLLTGGWALWLGEVVIGAIFYPPPEGVIRPLIVALSGLVAEPLIIWFAFLRMPLWQTYIQEVWERCANMPSP